MTHDPIRDNGNIIGVLVRVLDITEERAAAVSEERYRELVNHMTSGVVVYEPTADAADFVISDFNAAAQRIEQRAREEVIGRLVTEAFTGVEKSGLLAVLRRVARTGRQECYPIALYEDENLSSWRENDVYRLPSGEVVAVYDDVTERVRAGATLRESRQQLDEIAEQSRTVAWEVDAQGLYTHWSHVGEAVHGYRPDEVVGKQHFYDLHPEERREAFKTAAFAVFARKEPFVSLESAVSAKDGHIVWTSTNGLPLLDANGELLGYRGSDTDISERRQAEDALRESENRFRSLFADSPIAMWEEDHSAVKVHLERLLASGVKDIAAYLRSHPKEYLRCIELARTLAVNRAAAQLFTAASRQELFARTDDHHAAAQLDNLCLFWAALIAGERSVSYEETTLTLAGEPIELLETCTLAPGSEGSWDRIYIADADITELKRAAAAREREAAHTAALARMGTRLHAQGLDLEAVLAAVCGETQGVLSAPVVSLWLYDEAQDALVVEAELGLPPEMKGGNKVLSRSFCDELFAQYGPSAALPDLGVLASKPGGEAFAAAAHVAGAFAAMRRHDALIGALSVSAPGQTRVLTEEDVTLLQELADQAAQAITNARLYEEGQRRAWRLATLTRIDAVIASSLDLNVILDVTLDQVLTQLEVDAADILLLDASTQTLAYAAGQGFREEGITHGRLRITGDEEFARAITAGRLLHVHHLPAASDHPRNLLAEREGFRTYHAVPLIAKGQVAGLLEVYQRASAPCSAEWARFLETLAGQVAIGIDSVSLFQDVQRSNRELVVAYEATLDGWSRALDLRDRETQGHALRVADNTLVLARAMKLAQADLVHVRRGALLHDIGKMAIPDAILLKPGPLDEVDWEVMRRHPDYAYELLSPVAHLRLALDIPYCHHERWDGSGYPRSLKGAQIPLAARIFAVIDVWDALTSDRPYRKAWPEEKAVDHIRSQAGIHFDPDVVDAFLEALGDGSIGRGG